MKTLPKDITSLDLLKSLAVIIMVIDHVGFYLFPHHLILRAIGRMGFPIWFFLVGYARSRDISPRLLAGAFILLAADVMVGMPVVPLNALFTIICIRLLLPGTATMAFRTSDGLVMMGFLLILLFLPTDMVCEYGTIGLLTALFGYSVRHREVGKGTGLQQALAVATFLAFVGWQEIVFRFSLLPLAVMAAGTAFTFYGLLHLRPQTYPAFTKTLPAALAGLLRIGGRRTLEIYVIHLIVLKIVAALVFPDHYSWFHFHMFAWVPDPAVKHWQAL